MPSDQSAIVRKRGGNSRVGLEGLGPRALPDGRWFLSHNTSQDSGTYRSAGKAWLAGHIPGEDTIARAGARVSGEG